MSEEERLCQWLLATARMMVNLPDAVRVELIGAGEKITLRIYVHPVDFGKMVGNEGATGRALQTIGGAISEMKGKRFMLEIGDRDRYVA